MLIPRLCQNKVLLLHIFILNISSSIPFILILSTLNLWLVDLGISKTNIGLLSLGTLPYALKFLWAPYLDSRYALWIGARLGLRCGWIVLSQFCLIVLLIVLGSCDPQLSWYLMLSLILAIAACSATQDIAIEAYRIEVLPATASSSGVMYSVLGYRLGMWVAGAGALLLFVRVKSWQVVFNIMALLIFVSMLTTLLVAKKHPKSHNFLATKLTFWPKKHWSWLRVGLFLFFFKFADSSLQIMLIAFLTDIGFAIVEIAKIAKSFGLLMMIAGCCTSGLLLKGNDLKKSLGTSVCLHIFSGILFMCFLQYPQSFTLAYLVIGVQHFASGYAQVALVAYLSKLCHYPDTASSYAILTSLASLIRVVVQSCAGLLVEKTSWITFFGLMTLSGLPCLLMLYIIQDKKSLRWISHIN